MDSRYRFLTLGTPWIQSMPSRDVNAVTRLAEACWWRDNGCRVYYHRTESHLYESLMSSWEKHFRVKTRVSHHNGNIWRFYAKHSRNYANISRNNANVSRKNTNVSRNNANLSRYNANVLRYFANLSRYYANFTRNNANFCVITQFNSRNNANRFV